jgi:photosynthetic reaction center cytochrome c subunit
MTTRRLIIAAFLSLGLVAVIVATALAQSKAPTPAPKTAGEVFKNIQIFKDTPADQLAPAMQFISTSLGVGCDHCHVRGAFEKDDKKEKQTARKMMQMMIAINQNNFDGHRDVTCYSCHHGVSHPVSIPMIPEDDVVPPPAPSSDAASIELPAGDKLVEKYLQALGNQTDLHKLSSRSEKGKAIVAPGREYSLEAAYTASDKATSSVHMPDGDVVTGYNQQIGWQIFPGRPAHDMSDAEVGAAKVDSTFYFPLHVKELFSELKTTSTDKVGGHAVYVVTGRREHQPPVRLYLDQESGLLVRLLRYDETPVGRNPVQTDLSDYRDVNGIKVPFQRVTARPGRRMTVKIEQVQQNNVAADDSRFEKPATPAPPPTAPK